MGKSLFAVLLIFVLGVYALPAQARSDGYARPEYKDLVQTFIGLGGLDISDEEIINNYAKVIYCELFKKYFHNDFEWQKVKTAIKKNIAVEKNSYRTYYEIVGPVMLERYDFETTSFPISESSGLERVGSLVIYEGEAPYYYCDSALPPEIFPVNFKIILTSPFTLERITVSPENGQFFLDRMQKMGYRNTRVAYARMRLRIAGIQGFEGAGRERMAVFTGVLEQIDYYEDKDTAIFLSKGPRY